MRKPLKKHGRKIRTSRKLKGEDPTVCITAGAEGKTPIAAELCWCCLNSGWSRSMGESHRSHHCNATDLEFILTIEVQILAKAPHCKSPYYLKHKAQEQSGDPGEKEEYSRTE